MGSSDRTSPDTRMRVILCISVVTLATVQNEGFFSGITGTINNLFGGSGGNGRRPPPPRRPQNQFQPRPQQQFQPQPPRPQQQFNRQPAAPAFQPQQFRQPAFQQQQSQRLVRPSQNSFSQPQQQQQSSSQQPQQNTVTRISGGTPLCRASAPNHFWTDPRDGITRGYVVAWNFTDNLASCQKFQQSDARAYCKSMGMEPVSLDSPAKQDEFNRLVAFGAQRYFWTGGIVDHAQKTVFWSNGNARPLGFSESAHWSHTGGANPPRPQPDNRAKDEGHPETCLGVLNNFYADGIKWHDVACHHKKPTVCEPQN